MASSYKCKNVEKTWQHNATSRHEKCTLEGAIKEVRDFKFENLGKVWANKFYLKIFVACFKSYVYWLVHFLSFLSKKLIRNPKLPYLPTLMKNVRVDWCWKMKKCSEAFLNLHLLTRKILFLWNSNPLHHFYFGKLLRGRV